MKPASVYAYVKAKVLHGKDTAHIIGPALKHFPTRDPQKLKREAYSLIYRFKAQLRKLPEARIAVAVPPPPTAATTTPAAPAKKSGKSGKPVE